MSFANAISRLRVLAGEVADVRQRQQRVGPQRDAVDGRAEVGVMRHSGDVRFQDSIDVAAPAERVFATYADIERWPTWTASVTSVEVLDPGPLAVGTRAKVRQPRLPTATWAVTELVPGRSFTWVARGPGLRSTGTHAVAPRADGGCTVTATLDQDGILGGLVGRLTRSMTEQYLAMEVRGIKECCER
jgi:uncharacterized membrane protein